MDRRLNLRKDTLVPLETDELALVDGAAAWTPWCHVTIGLGDRISELAGCV